MAIGADILRSEIDRRNAQIAQLRAEVRELNETLKRIDGGEPEGSDAEPESRRPPRVKSSSEQVEEMREIGAKVIEQFNRPATVAAALRLLFQREPQGMSVEVICSKLALMMGKPVNKDTVYAQLSVEAKPGGIVDRLGDGMYRARPRGPNGAILPLP